MNKKTFVDMVICSISAAIMILCMAYMEDCREKELLLAVCAGSLVIFLLLAIFDVNAAKAVKRKKGGAIQVLVLLDEDGGEISAWHIGGKTSVLIGRDTKNENVDINLQNTEYGGMVDRQHAVLNYAGGKWYIEDLGSKNGVRIQNTEDGKIYQVSREHLCRVNAGDIILIGNTRLYAK